MCIALRHDRVHPPHPQYREWEPTVFYGHGRRRAGFHTSGTEILHLALALVLLAFAFGLFIGGVHWDFETSAIARKATSFIPLATPVGDVFVISGLAVGSGFLLHELMHKFVAQFYGHWAEFRAKAFGLLIPVPIAFFLQFIFAAPGAVIISGNVNRKENGLISAAGPGMNLVIAAAAYPFTLAIGSVDTFGYLLAQNVMTINAFLAIFNMIPLGPLDGRKVWRWNPGVYILVVLLAVGAFMLALRA